MELQFNKESCRCLRTVVDSVQSREETQEVRISDGLPDIGRIVGCWGQAVVRGKEWRSDEIRVSGGVMAWVAYAPEDGSGIRCVETWLPMQFRWDVADSQRDGQICVMPRLSQIDARSISARKMMVRAAVSVCAEALEPTEITLYKPDALPEDIQLLRRTYPLELPQEAGEKLFQLEEVIKLPLDLVRPEKILHYELTPVVTEQKIMANRLVFRGSGMLYMLYTGTDGMLHIFRHEVPYSQYTELDRDYGGSATAWVIPVVTSLELTRSEDDTVAMNAGIAAQYVIYDRQMLELGEDAYSNIRTAEPIFEEISLPVLLDSRQLDAELTGTLPANAQNIAELCWTVDQPEVLQGENAAQIKIAGQFQALYYDEEGNLQTSTGKAETSLDICSDEQNRLRIWPGKVTESTGGCCMDVQVMTFSAASKAAVSGLQIGEAKQPDEARPSLILCKVDGESLWNVAKRHGSTVDEIMSANGLHEEPQEDEVLLIPVK